MNFHKKKKIKDFELRYGDIILFTYLKYSEPEFQDMLFNGLAVIAIFKLSLAFLFKV